MPSLSRRQPKDRAGGEGKANKTVNQRWNKQYRSAAGGVPANPVALCSRRWCFTSFSAGLTGPLPDLAILSHDHPYSPNWFIAAKTTSLTDPNQDHGHNEYYKHHHGLFKCLEDDILNQIQNTRWSVCYQHHYMLGKVALPSFLHHPPCRCTNNNNRFRFIERTFQS